MSDHMTKLEAERGEDEWMKRQVVVSELRICARKLWSEKAKKVADSFKEDSDVALRIILDDWNDPAAIGRKMKIFVDDYLREIE